MNFLDRLNGKSKGEQIFILLLFGVAGFCLMGMTGCFGCKSCELPSYDNFDYDGVSAMSCSIPGCGGCLSSGRGCNTACWSQSCKFVSLSADEGDEGSFSMTGCDIRYYGGGCLGCGQSEKSCYSGCMDYSDPASTKSGVFYGSTDSEEKLIGCENGCGGCVASNHAGQDMITMTEKLAQAGNLMDLANIADWLNGSMDSGAFTGDDTEAESGQSFDEYEIPEPEPESEPEPDEGVVMECYRFGRINTHGETVAGFKTSYVVDGGKAARVRKSLGNGWHVVSNRYCYSKKIWWYELYDSEDGDYYGWVDAAFIDFDD